MEKYKFSEFFIFVNYKFLSNEPMIEQEKSEQKSTQSASPQAKRTLIGAILIKFATGLIASWGTNNLYFISLLYFQDPESVSPSTNSIIIITTIVPVSLFILLAYRVSLCFGYENTVKGCSWIYAISPLVTIFIEFKFWQILLFLLLIPGTCFAISTIPVINCLWSQYPKIRNQVTSFTVIFFALGGVFWNLAFMYYVNPHNKQAEIEVFYKDGNQKMVFFTKEIAQRVHSAAIFGYLLSGIIFIIGARLIRKKRQQQKENILLEKNQEKNQIQRQNVKSKDRQSISRIQWLNPNDQQWLNKQDGLSKPPKNIWAALLDKRFVLLFFVSLISGLYHTYLTMNYKLIYMPLINDDHFLTYCFFAYTFSSIIGAFIWGWVADQKQIAYTLLLVTTTDFIFKFLGNFGQSKTAIFTTLFMVGLTDKSLLTIIGPGYVEFFGLQLGTQLLPFKGVSVFLGFIIAPSSQIILQKTLGFDKRDCLKFLTGITFFSVILSAILYKKFGKKQIK